MKRSTAARVSQLGGLGDRLHGLPSNLSSGCIRVPNPLAGEQPLDLFPVAARVLSTDFERFRVHGLFL